MAVIKVYERAEKSVFATSTGSYFEVWVNHLGKEILKAHSNSKAKDITRVFLFQKLDDVTLQQVKEMKKQGAIGNISVRMWGNDDDVTYNLPDNLNPNFAFIDDGDVIASSTHSETGKIGGIFYFKDDDKRKAYKSIIDNLREGSISLDDFLKTRPHLADSAEAASGAPSAS